MPLSIFLFIVFLLIPGFNLNAGPNQDLPAAPALPSERGEVVFSCNERSPNQIYIIGMGHRDTLTRANGSNTMKSQIEVYRIGEWLIQKEGLELLLPEGFFAKAASDEKEYLIKTAASSNGESTSFDIKTLEEKLGEKDAYINAEMLLIESHSIKSQQVEDLNLYNAVREKINLLEKYGDDTYESLFIKSGLDYLQERRSAAMLQKIPEIIDSEYRMGRIKNKKAIFTIGLSHISGIIKYLKQNKIEIYSPAFSRYDDYLSGVKLLEKDFGVTIIIPRTLANDRELLRLTRLDDIH
ncbi:MAG: hypothetical protein HZB61_14660 [Nitrospirae bacterium]|nr:hypothetical protein [Nitrospirota bacterium]